MVSTANPTPDSSCELKSNDNSEQCQFKVDLSGLEEKNPLPNFSTRNYVVSKRQKDMRKNWPFSEKTSQLCLKHNVKDVLPPFESLDSVKNSSALISIDENITSLSPEHNFSPNLVVAEKKIWSSTSGKRKELKSTTSQSCSNLNDHILKPVKKCNLTMKLNSIARPKMSEDLPMSSKVCTVCNLFLSTSNTTLNAHIDWCLSVESTIKCTSNLKSTKHRIKPRKTRLMVDIQKAALRCTLEDLDKRNGTVWNLNMGFTVQSNDACGEEKNITCPSTNIEENENKNGDSDVCIDSSGTKVRIRSKFHDPPSSKSFTNKVGKFHCEKKNYLVNENMASKFPPKVADWEEREFSTEAHKIEELTQHFGTYDQMTSNDKGMIKQWVTSKRTCLRKKMSLEHQEKLLKILGLTLCHVISS